MTATILDGKGTAAAVKAELADRVSALADVGGAPDWGPSSWATTRAAAPYVGGKHRDCEQVGIASLRVDLSATASAATVEAAIDDLNADPSCTGYIIQLPLPRGLDANAMLERMDPAKDADGLHPTNLGRLVLRAAGPLPCTPKGIVELLRRYQVPIAGAEVVVVGRGVTVGRPLGLLLTRRSENATVTLCATQEPGICRRICATPTSSWRPLEYRASSAPTTSSPAPRCWTSGSLAPIGASSAMSIRRCVRWRVTWRRCRAVSAR